MGGAHSRFAPSSAERWTRCPYSVSLAEQCPARETEYAARGTAAHKLLYRCLVRRLDPHGFVGETIYRTQLPGQTAPYEVTVDERMARWVLQAAEYVWEVLGPKSQSWYETPLSFERWVPGGWGTADVLLLHDDGVLEVIDAKFGTGHRVSATGVDGQGNRQMLCYALGAWDDLVSRCQAHVNSVKLTVVQPPLDVLEHHVVSPSFLLDFGERLREAATLALSERPPASPSEEACRWCPGQAVCEPLQRHLHESLRVELAEEFSTPDELAATASWISSAPLARMLEVIPLYERWVQAVRTEALDRLLLGEEVPGWKLVAGRSQRRWADEERALAWLRQRGYADEDILETRLIGIPAAEKLVGRNVSGFAELVVKPPGAPTLARAADPRPDYCGTVTAVDFDIVTDE